jgi:hypothetical protein
MQPLGATKSQAQSTSLAAVKITSIEERSIQTGGQYPQQAEMYSMNHETETAHTSHSVWMRDSNKETKEEEIIIKERERWRIKSKQKIEGRSQWQRCLRRGSAVARLLRSWVRIPPGASMYVCCECCVLSGRGLCDELITRPEECYRLWCVVVCDLETS